MVNSRGFFFFRGDMGPARGRSIGRGIGHTDKLLLLRPARLSSRMMRTRTAANQHRRRASGRLLDDREGETKGWNATRGFVSGVIGSRSDEGWQPGRSTPGELAGRAGEREKGKGRGKGGRGSEEREGRGPAAWQHERRSGRRWREEGREEQSGKGRGTEGGRDRAGRGGISGWVTWSGVRLFSGGWEESQSGPAAEAGVTAPGPAAVPVLTLQAWGQRATGRWGAAGASLWLGPRPGALVLFAGMALLVLRARPSVLCDGHALSSSRCNAPERPAQRRNHGLFSFSQARPTSSRGAGQVDPSPRA